MTASPSAPAPIPEEQWTLPVSYYTDGGMVTLRDYVHPTRPVLTPAQLADQQRAEVTAERISRKAKFAVGMLGVGILDKARALIEVRARTTPGKVLIEIEFRLIQNMIRQATAQ